MKNKIYIGVVTIVCIAIFSACKKNDFEKLRKDELKKLEQFITNNYPTLNPTASGLFYIEQEKGIGDSIEIGDRVQIFYTIWSLDSIYIDGSGEYEPMELTVLPPTQLSSSATAVTQLKGLHEALTYMKKDSKSLLIMPSELAFGQTGSVTIGVPGFTTLLMEVEVYKVYPAQSQ